MRRPLLLACAVALTAGARAGSATTDGIICMAVQQDIKAAAGAPCFASMVAPTVLLPAARCPPLLLRSSDRVLAYIHAETLRPSAPAPQRKPPTASGRRPWKCRRWRSPS